MNRAVTGFRPYLLLSLLCLVLYLPGLVSIPPFDRDEARFAQASRQMIETGDFVRIQFQDEIRAKKPVGAYWAQALSIAALTDPARPEIWAHRLPSLLAGLAATLLAFFFGTHLADRKTAFLGAALLGSCLIVIVEAHLAKTDALLLACVVAGQGALGRLWMAGRGPHGEHPPGLGTALVFWIAQGIAILIKGPILPMISLFTLLWLCIGQRRWAWTRGLKPLIGLPLCVLIVLPWTIAITQATDGGFIGQAVQEDLIPKLMGAQERHGGLPGYYLALLSITFWPASLLVWPALFAAWRGRSDPLVTFLLAWIIPSWILFELVPTKLPHYTMPLYPALALLIAWAVQSRAPALTARAARIWYGIWGILGLVFAGAFLFLPLEFGRGIGIASLLAAIGACAAGLLAAKAAYAGRTRRALAIVLPAAAIMFIATFGGIAPVLDRIWVSRSLAEAVARINRPGPVATAGYSEPSLIFLLGTDTKIVNGDGAAQQLLGRPDSIAIVEDRERATFDKAIGWEGRRTEELARVEGLNYSRGRLVGLSLLALVPKP